MGLELDAAITSVLAVLCTLAAVQTRSYSMSAAVALCEARLGLLAHEAAHLNHRVQLLFDFAMGSHAHWKRKHHQGHHAHTNGALDPDVDLYPLMRVSPFHVRLWFHRFQWLYQWLLFPLVPFGLRASGVAHVYRHGGVLAHHMRAAPAFALHIVYPYCACGVAGWSHYLWTCCVLGWIYGALFGVSHVNEAVDWEPVGDRTSRQLKATADWSPGSEWANWLTVGLNHQAVHHVHPRRPSCDYCALQVELRRHPEYRSFPSLLAALRSNKRHLQRMGAA